MVFGNGFTEYRFSLRIILLVLFSSLAILVASACTLQSVTTPPPSPGVVHTMVAQTMEAQFTLSAQPPTDTRTPGSPSNTPVPTQLSQPTQTPTQTPTYTDTPVPPPPTPSVPMITATVNTNCRFGPSKYYEVIGYLLVGQWEQVIGRSADGYWWYIQNPSRLNSKCWVWDQTTVVTGNISNLPVITAPPLPPPTTTPVSPPEFTASFDNRHDCGGEPFAILKITNTGVPTFESMKLTLDDLTASTTLSIVNSDIPFLGAPTECPVGAENIPTGAVRFVAGMLGSPAPSGHQARATIKLCTNNNLKGACTVRTVDFTVP